MSNKRGHQKQVDEDAPLPDSGYLYKYRSLKKGTDRENTLAILKSNQMWWGRGSSFNDPFDCNHHIDYERTDEEWEQYFARGLDKGFQFLRSKYEEAKARSLGNDATPIKNATKKEKPGRWEFTVTDKSGNPVKMSQILNRSRARSLKRNLRHLDKLFGVLCLSHDPDNILLWSHYANSHNGICLQFDVASYRDAFPRLHPVTYRAEALDLEAPIQDLFAMLQSDPKLLLDIAALMRGSNAKDEHSARAVEQWFYTKSTDWTYEQEWRALIAKPGLNRFPARALTGVIVGCVNTEENLALVREAIDKKRPRPKVYVATKKRDEFGLDIDI